jgi:hypothetical protein
MPLAPRHLVFVLTLLVLVGHVCELPIEAVVDWHIHESGHLSADRHSHDGQPDESQISCEPVLGVQPNGSVRADRGPSVFAERVSLASGVPVRVLAVPRYESNRPSRRPPLFVLHSSLLI